MTASQNTLIAGLVAMLLSLPAASTELSGTPEELKEFLRAQTRTVTLSEVARETAYTDTAIVSLTVRTEGKQLGDSLAANERLRQDVARELVAAGIDAESIHSARYAASPQYGWFGKSPSSYEVVNGMTVTVQDAAQFRAVAAAADSRAEVSFSGVRFEHSGEEEFTRKVRDQALATIMESAGYFEKSLGLKLTPVSFAFGEPRIMPNSAIEEVIVTASRVKAAEPVIIDSFDEVDYEARVSVTFEVVPAL